MHIDPDLSAYLDGEVPAADVARVEAHLASCARCAERLAELRATASLIAGLPAASPSRSLVPRVAERWNPLRPVRSLSAVASGAFLFAFLVTAVARAGGGLGGGLPSGALGPISAPAAAPAPAATTAAQATQAVPFAIPAPGAAVATANADVAQKATSAGVTSAPPQFAAPLGVATPTPSEAGPSAPSELARSAQQSEQAAARSTVERPGPSPLTEPFVWLGLAVIAAVIAIEAHRRLRPT